MLNVSDVSLGGRIYNIKTRETNSGTLVCSFTVTVFKKRGEGKPDAAVFVECQSYGGKAKVISENFKHGDQIFITGELDQFESKDGKRITVVNLKDFCFVDKKSA